MSAATLGRLVRQVRRRIDPAGESGDASLLARWIDQADQSAFELLLWRHGPMVWDTCRRVLRHDQDAEDAFQAAFLALARRAGSIRRSPSLAGWLYRVAHRAALAARSRPGRAESRPDLDEVAAARGENEDLRRCLDEEIERLPQRYREPFVLCYLQGLTTDEAAEVLAARAAPSARASPGRAAGCATGWVDAGRTCPRPSRSPPCRRDWSSRPSSPPPTPSRSPRRSPACFRRSSPCCS